MQNLIFLQSVPLTPFKMSKTLCDSEPVVLRILSREVRVIIGMALHLYNCFRHSQHFFCVFSIFIKPVYCAHSLSLSLSLLIDVQMYLEILILILIILLIEWNLGPPKMVTTTKNLLLLQLISSSKPPFISFFTSLKVEIFFKCFIVFWYLYSPAYP